MTLPTQVTQEQKDKIIALIREGKTRAEAAKAVGTTGTRVGRLASPESKTYDPEFSAAYRDALYERENGKGYKVTRGEPEKVTLQGYTKAKYLTAEQMEGYLERVRDGIPIQMAALEVGTSRSQIKARANRDPVFRQAIEDATTEGKPLYVERLNTIAYKLAENGNYNAARDLLIIHDPAWSVLRTSRHEITGANGGVIKMLTASLPALPPHILEELIQLAESGQDVLPALTQGNGSS